VRYLFTHTTVQRLEAAIETGNIAEQKALERAGSARKA
jgi:RimJ/RimL family protein N-acetyltransferase